MKGVGVGRVGERGRGRKSGRRGTEKKEEQGQKGSERCVQGP